MRLLADENFPRKAVVALEEHGHDVLWARRDMIGSSDRVILARAQTESRVVITFDKDFGELAFRFGLPASCGIILFRVAIRSQPQAVELALATLETRSDWTGIFAVVEFGRVRVKPLPT